MERILEKAKQLIEEKMNKEGFIDDSTGCPRFLDEVSTRLSEEEFATKNPGMDDDTLHFEKGEEIIEFSQQILEKIRENIMVRYKLLESVGEVFIYHNTNKEFKDIEEFNKHFGIGE